jgi:hypothetical protein
LFSIWCVLGVYFLLAPKSDDATDKVTYGYYHYILFPLHAAINKSCFVKSSTLQVAH